MSVLIPVAEGSESLETVTLVNVLRRASIEVVLASIEAQRQVAATRGIQLVADARLDDVAERSFDAIILPGGETGSRRFAECRTLVSMLSAQRIAHRWYGAVCAAPALALSPHGLLDGKQATCHPAYREHLLHFVDQPVVADGHCITSQGAGTTLPFALHWVERLAGSDARRKVAEGMVIAA